MAPAQVLLGEDGRGFELARRLEASGVWRTWLGDTAYAAFTPSLASPSAWETFMASSPSSKSQIQIQLRVRALLFDKASVALFLRHDVPSSLASVNPTYLHLHADDVYFTLEDDAASDYNRHQDGSEHPMSKTQSRQGLAQSKVNGHFYDRASSESITPKHRLDELPDSWYDRYIEKHKKSSPHKYPFGDTESLKRTPEGMSSYLRQIDMHKRCRQVFMEDQCMGKPNKADNTSQVQADLLETVNLIPEMMFPSNCVPDNAISPANVHGKNQKQDVYGVLDSLPQLISPSQAMIERFGIRPEYIRVEFGRSKYRGNADSEGMRKSLSEEQASHLTQRVVAQTFATAGVDGGSEVLMEVLSQFLGSHISRLGHILKLLSDSYRKQFSSTELINMFLKISGYSNLGMLSDYVKDSNRVVTHQSQHQMQSMQHKGHILQSQQQQQVQRLMQTQLNPLHSQNMAFQQQMMQRQMFQQQQLRRRQVSAACASSMMEHDRSMMDVKLENMIETPMDGSFSNMNRQQLQFRQQQMAIANVNHQSQSAHQFKQFNSVQVPQIQAQGSFNSRSQAMKVEGFQELMGGDTVKHESDERKLTSPSK